MIFYCSLLTDVSASDIMIITATDIMGVDKEDERMPGAALTEAVYYILLSLIEPMHGYGIMQNVERQLMNIGI